MYWIGFYSKLVLYVQIDVSKLAEALSDNKLAKGSLMCFATAQPQVVQCILW